MGTILTIKSGDRYPTYWTVPMDLTNCTVRLLARRGSNPVVTLPSTVSNPTGGVVQHVLDGTLGVGTYAVELEITRGTDIITAPTDSYENLRVIADLD
jgi:hypothetical protein